MTTKRRHGSWQDNPVKPGEIDVMHVKVQAIVDAEFGVDDEDDHTVDVILVDRTHYESMHYWPIRYPHDGPAAFEAALRVAMMNHRIASETLHRILDMQERDKESQRVDDEDKRDDNEK